MGTILDEYQLGTDPHPARRIRRAFPLHGSLDDVFHPAELFGNLLYRLVAALVPDDRLAGHHPYALDRSEPRGNGVSDPVREVFVIRWTEISEWQHGDLHPVGR